MKITKLAAAAAATAVTVAFGAVTAAPASATDNIKTFGEQERLNGPNGFPYIGYTVFNLAPSNDPVPHNGTLYAAKLVVDGFGGNYPPMIERFGARARTGEYYPSIWGASNMSKLYFDVVGVVPNSVVWNDGTRDILAWVPGESPLEPKSAMDEPPPDPVRVVPGPEVVPGSAEAPAIQPGAVPTESDAAIVATPNQEAAPPYQLSEAEVAEPGFGR
ncbi:DUF1942 domain-containing protein [Mycolicibacterium sp.]|uniref:DUF1942 domain-containing protein n=1 Tax=Mycolicibacterium sp. TaxID=2320850 RepID=UPI001DA24239|nr:DUF1942 domain-containing protein [Mycolicibacterium sp.]MCB1265509.1 DUF1942 domain-containing protein [Mycobacterium sp.]MCB1290479.1 DUF1942 domain-containing protein [Mycobacterium sp.]MCB9408517.1 DUF1942 domain-containing protein [Mycolicibacterium sp.]